MRMPKFHFLYDSRDECFIVKHLLYQEDVKRKTPLCS